MTSDLTIDCNDCALARLACTRDFTQDELAVVRQYKAGDIHLEAGSDILAVGSNSAHLWTLYSGFAFRHVILPDGRRQILNFLFPTDFIGLQASLFGASEHVVTALTDVHLCVFQRKQFLEIFERAPNLGYDVTWVSASEHAFVDLNLVAVGQFRADQRVAFLLLSIFERMTNLALADENSCQFPFTQQHVADALGLTLPHTNKALRKLAREGVSELKDGHLHILNRDSISERALVPPRRIEPIRFI